MSSFGAAMLFSIVALTLIIFGGVWLMNRAAAGLVGSKHHLLQGIVETGEVPAEWSKHYRRKLARLENNDHREQAARVEQQARQHYLQNLDQLIRYAETSALVDGEDTRALLLRRLADVRTAWQEQA